MIGVNIFRTFLSRSGTAIINLIVVMLSARILGDEGMGMISLLILTITISALFGGLWGGAGLVYLTPRHPLKYLLLIGYGWSVISSLLVVYVFGYFHLFPGYFGNNIYLLVIVNSFASINMYLLLGKEKIVYHNIITFFQSFVLLISILAQFYLLKYVQVAAYLLALYVSFGFVWITSSIILLRLKLPKVAGTLVDTFKHTIKYSLVLQTGSGVQLLNYRFSYYIIDHFLGTAMLGRFSVAVQLAEGIWILGKSFGLVLYSKVSNQNKILDSVKTSLPLIKISVIGTIIATFVILIIPSTVFTFLFGKDFSHVHSILLFLAPGIVFVSATMLFSSFFSGVGMIKINTQGSLIGLVSTLLFSVVLIYYYGLTGAAIATSLSYFSSFVYAQYNFKKVSGIGINMYLVSYSDVENLKLLVRGLFAHK